MLVTRSVGPMRQLDESSARRMKPPARFKRRGMLIGRIGQLLS